MDGKERRLLSASEVSMKLGVCRSKAYEITRELKPRNGAARVRDHTR